MVSNGKGKSDRNGCGLLHMTSTTGLFKQETCSTIKINITTAVTWIEFIKRFFGEIHRANTINRLGEILSIFWIDFFIEVVGNQWIITCFLTWIKIKTGVGPHFMMICLHIRAPFVEEVHPVSGLWKCSKEPISVQIKPIVIGSAAWPDFIVFSIIGISNWWKGFVHIGPVGMAISSIRINYRIQQNNHILHPLVSLFRL